MALVNDSADDPVSSGPLRVMHATAIIIAGTLGVLANLLVIVAVATTAGLRTAPNAFVVNLSLVDFLMSAVCAPLYAAGVLAEGWPFHPAVCRANALLNLLLLHVDVFSLGAVASVRYLRVTRRPASNNRCCSRRHILVILISAWLQGILVAVVAEFVVKVDIRYQPNVASCALNPRHVSTQRYVSVVICALVFTLMVLIPALYGRLLLAVRASRKRVGQRVGQPPRPDRFARPHQHVITITRDEARLVKMFALLTAIFAVLYMPISVIFVFGARWPVLLRGAGFGKLALTAAPAINPLIYPWMNPSIRTACYRLITRKATHADHPGAIHT